MKHPARLKSKVSRIILTQSGRGQRAAIKNGVWGGACCITPVCGRVHDSRPRGCEFKPHRRHCVVVLEQDIYPSLVLVQPRKTRPYIT